MSNSQWNPSSFPTNVQGQAGWFPPPNPSSDVQSPTPFDVTQALQAAQLATMQQLMYLQNSNLFLSYPTMFSPVLPIFPTNQPFFPTQVTLPFQPVPSTPFSLPPQNSPFTSQTPTSPQKEERENKESTKNQPNSKRRYVGASKRSLNRVDEFGNPTKTQKTDLLDLQFKLSTSENERDKLKKDLAEKDQEMTELKALLQEVERRNQEQQNHVQFLELQQQKAAIEQLNFIRNYKARNQYLSQLETVFEEKRKKTEQNGKELLSPSSMSLELNNFQENSFQENNFQNVNNFHSQQTNNFKAKNDDFSSQNSNFLREEETIIDFVSDHHEDSFLTPQNETIYLTPQNPESIYVTPQNPENIYLTPQNSTDFEFNFLTPSTPQVTPITPLISTPKSTQHHCKSVPATWFNYETLWNDFSLPAFREKIDFSTIQLRNGPNPNVVSQAKLEQQGNVSFLVLFLLSVSNAQAKLEQQGNGFVKKNFLKKN